MKKSISFFKKLICPFLVLGLLAGCGKAEPIDCPYTDLDWDATKEEMESTYGSYKEEYKSTYGGQTYTYEASYMNKDGIIKYMFDEDGVLMNTAWAFGSEDAAELNELYEKILSETEEVYGEGKAIDDEINNTNYGNVWQLEQGHIILSVMITDSNKALQIAYENPLDQKK